MKVGGIVLCGGKSQRMGRPKATLPFGEEVMLQRVVRLLAEVVDPIVVVAAPELATAGQSLPPLPSGVLLAHDRRSGRGPLEGIYAGLLALEGHCDAAYATACDVPLLSPRFVSRMIDSLNGHELAVPLDGRFHHPLAAVYRVSVSSQIKTLLDADRLRPFFLFGEVDTVRIPVETLREVDPQLGTLENLNYPQDYFAAMDRAGFQVPTEVRQQMT